MRPVDGPVLVITLRCIICLPWREKKKERGGGGAGGAIARGTTSAQFFL